MDMKFETFSGNVDILYLLAIKLCYEEFLKRKLEKKEYSWSFHSNLEKNGDSIPSENKKIIQILNDH